MSPPTEFKNGGFMFDQFDYDTDRGEQLQKPGRPQKYIIGIAQTPLGPL